ncbi:MAG: isoaspartyl peptidase/L-asparaginase [Bdellovibrionales bacterium]|nr:isoaspartyl peptidase/L-asparaginase [Bdellovibrionales bacterium]
MWTVLTHGGAGSDPAHVDGTQKAADRALGLLRSGQAPLDAVVEAVRDLEDDPRFNAGTGSSLRVDGVTAELDASCMDSEGGLGAVTGLRRLRNPVLVARAVMETKHIALGGEGAQAFARERGHGDYDPVTKESRSKAGRVHGPTDTVGAVASDGTRFAAALSTGGVAGAMIGRIGDVPFPGCGLFAGGEGAVAATGQGEEIARRVLAYEAYRRLAAGEAPRAVVEELVARFPALWDLGLIVVGRKGSAGGSNRRMAWSTAQAALV